MDSMQLIIIVLVHRHEKSSQIVTEEDSMPPIIIVLVHRHEKSSQIQIEEKSDAVDETNFKKLKKKKKK
jgi:hypothetical protein